MLYKRSYIYILDSLKFLSSLEYSGICFLIEEDDLQGSDENRHEDDEADGDADAEVLLHFSLVLNERHRILRDWSR